MKYLIPILALIVGFAGGVWISGDTDTEQVQALENIYFVRCIRRWCRIKPGSCPICGMDLVEKEVDGGHGHEMQADHETYILSDASDGGVG